MLAIVSLSATAPATRTTNSSPSPVLNTCSGARLSAQQTTIANGLWRGPACGARLRQRLRGRMAAGEPLVAGLQRLQGFVGHALREQAAEGEQE
jgi:hypothetical protein